MPVRAVIFDLDGVVVDSEPLHLASFNEIIKAYGAEPIKMAEWRAKYVGRGSQAIWEDFKKKYALPHEIYELHEKRHVIYHRLAKERLKTLPGLKEFTDFLKEKKIRMMIATNSELDDVHMEMGLAHVKDIPRITRDKVAHLKPAPDIYNLAIERLDLRPDECMIIDDSVTGVTAAHRAGAFVVGMANIQDPVPLIEAGAAFCVHDFLDLMDRHGPLF